MRTKGITFVVPPQFTTQTGALTPDSHQGSAITGLPVSVYSSRIGYFFDISTRRHSVRFTEGGFQPVTSPSLTVLQPLTPPGYDCIINFYNYT